MKCFSLRLWRTVANHKQEVKDSVSLSIKISGVKLWCIMQSMIIFINDEKKQLNEICFGTIGVTFRAG